jgi:hypothetical protein
MALCAVGVVAGATGAHLDWSLVTGHRAQAALTAAAVILLCGWGCGLVWFLFLGGARTLYNALSERLYDKEGRAALERPRTSALLLLAYLGCLMAMAVLGFMGFHPLRYAQPIFAAFFVPYVTYVLYRQRGADSPFIYLMPLLFGLHAVAVLLGAPLQWFHGEMTGLNLIIPLFGYGLIAALAGHIYSRYALRKLRRLASVSPEEAHEE